MMMRETDIECMLRLKKGDQTAFRVLFERYKRKIVNYCYRFHQDRQVAEELAQEVFLRVFRGAPKYQPMAEFSTWIFKIATHVCLNEIRKGRYKQKIESLDKTSETDGETVPAKISDESQLSAEDQIEKKEQVRMIQDAMANLPEKQRAALLLRVTYGFSYQEISRQLNCSEKSVKSLIFRGREGLKCYFNRF